jgi:uncharacterized membrane protein YbhN (UPF0104 family)
VGIVAIVAAGAVYAVYRDRHDFSTAYVRLGPGLIVLAFLSGLVGVIATYMSWRQILVGLGVNIPWKSGARVFFVSQLGKYVPGSVWSALMQMEAGKAHGASRRTMLGANAITIVIGCATGLVVACILLPIYDLNALTTYWWVMLALPVLLALLHPRALPAVIDRAFRLLHRPPLGEQVDFKREMLASGWFVLSWLALGLQVGILAAGSVKGHAIVPLLLLSVGGMALATTAGLLFVPAPAGAGIRDVVLALVLGTVMSTGSAVVVVVASRALLTLADVLVAALSGAFFRRRGQRQPAPAHTVSCP